MIFFFFAMNRNMSLMSFYFYVPSIPVLDEGSGPEDENMEEVVPEDEGSSQGLSTTAPPPEPKLAKTPKKKMSKKKAVADVDVS